MRSALCAVVLVLAVAGVGCGQKAANEPAAQATPAATSGAGQQPADSPDLANEGFDAGDSEELEPAQGAEVDAAADEGS
jgi:hypothetical protein